jgi:hypothetical protein
MEYWSDGVLEWWAQKSFTIPNPIFHPSIIPIEGYFTISAWRRIDG